MKFFHSNLQKLTKVFINCRLTFLLLGLFLQSASGQLITDSSNGWPRQISEANGSWSSGKLLDDGLAEDAAFTPFSEMRRYDFTFIEGGQMYYFDGENSYPKIGKYVMAPSEDEYAVKRWVSQSRGKVTVVLDVQLILKSVNGVGVSMRHNGEEVYTQSLGREGEVLCDTKVIPLVLKKGDILDFLVSSRGDHHNDWTYLNAKIMKGNTLFQDAGVYLPFDEEIDFPSDGLAVREGRVPNSLKVAEMEEEIAKGTLMMARRKRSVDFTGKGRHATLDRVLEHPMWSPGVRGNAISVSSSNTIGRLDAEGIGKQAEALTVSFWMAPNGLERNQYASMISTKGNDCVGFSIAPEKYEGHPIEFRIISDIHNHLDQPAEEKKMLGLIRANGVATRAHEWTHVTGVWRSGKRFELYLNGKLAVASDDPPKGSLDIDEWLLGASGHMMDRRGRYFCGLLDELVIFPKAVTPKRVASIYQQTLQRARPEVKEGCGYLRREEWYQKINHTTIQSLYRDPKFHKGPHDVWCMGGSETGRYSSRYLAKRIRGYVRAPESGHYQFWLASTGASEMSLSPNERKFDKTRMIELSRELGNGKGISPNHGQPYDIYRNQASDLVYLEKGQKYFLEIVQTQGGINSGNIQLAWRPPAGERQLIDPENLFFYRPESDNNDLDDDYLPDDWEKKYGLDPQNAGTQDASLQGERGDFDQDGLTNHEEYLAGTDPTNSDTDGDGFSDGEEAHTFHSDPLRKEGDQGRSVAKIAPQDYSHSDHDWINIDGTLVSNHYRGRIEWTFEVPIAGAYYYELALRLQHTIGVSSEVPLKLFLDDRLIAYEKLDFHHDKLRIWRVLGSPIAAGTHRLTLHIENDLLRRSVGILGVEVFAPTGIDQNGDGLPDWYASALYDGTTVAAHAATSAVSPFFIEGTVAQAQDSASGGESAVFVNGTPARALGQHHWYADVPLGDTENELKLTLPDGRELARNITWTTTNILKSQDLRIRPGDTLKFGAINPKGAARNGRLQINGSAPIQISADQPYQHTFTESGQYKLIGRSAKGGRRIRINVEVVQAALPARVSTVLNLARDLPLLEAQYSQGVHFSGSEGLLTELFTHSQTGVPQLRVVSTRSAPQMLAARLYENGPIITTAEVPVITLVNSLSQGSTLTFSSGAPQGYERLHAPLVVLGLPEGAYVELSIFRSGIIFTDGSSVKRLYAADFEDGLAFVDFLFPKNLPGGYCHHLSIYDADGTRLSGQ